MAIPTLKEFRTMKGNLEERIYRVIEELSGGALGPDSVGEEELKDKAVTLEKMDDLPDGEIIIGDEDDRPSTQLLSELLPVGGSGGVGVTCITTGSIQNNPPTGDDVDTALGDPNEREAGDIIIIEDTTNWVHLLLFVVPVGVGLGYRYIQLNLPASGGGGGS